MDNRTIFSKTGKGSLEISKKTIKLASDERQTLILVDGKSNLGEIEEKLSRISAVRLRAIMDRLVELDLVREFVTKQGPDSIMPSLGGPTAMKVEELDELDFTALSPASSTNTVKEVDDRRQAAEQAETHARIQREAEAKVAAEMAERRRVEEEVAARTRAEAEARQRAEDEARRRAEDEARRRAEEDARRRAEEDARRRAEEDARRKAEEEARRRAEEEARRRAEEEARKRAEEEARHRAEEDARRRAEEEVRRKAEEDARRRAEEEARRRAEEEARRKAEDEARRRAEDERRQREETERRAAAEAEARERARREEEGRRATIADEKRRREQAEAEAAERFRREEAEREEADRRAAAEAQQRERARREEETKRATIAEEKRRREEAEAAAHREARLSADDAERRASEEAARYTAALTPHLEEAAAQPAGDLDLDFGSATPSTGAVESVDLKPLAGGGPDTFADTGADLNSRFEANSLPGDDDDQEKRSVEKEARRELEREAKERAKEDAKARKEAEREAKRQAKAGKVKVRRGSGGGGGGGGFSLGKFIAIFVVLLIVGGIGYLYMMPIDKRLIEGMATARLGMPVAVGSASFSPFPPQLSLTNVKVDDMTFPKVVAVPDPGSLAADRKVFKSIDISGAQLTVAQVKKLIAVGLTEAPKSVAMTMQRVRITGVTVSDSPIPLPSFDVTALLAADGTVRQANFALADNKGQLQLSQDDKGWLVDFESHGITWPLGPKTAWESLRAKGLADANGIKFDSIAIAHFAGNITGKGDLSWNSGWKFGGSMEVGGLDTVAIAQAYYDAAPVTGTIDGKFSVNMSASSLMGLVQSTKMDGSVVVNKAAVANIDLARTAQAGGITAGATRFGDFVADVTTDGARVQVKNVRANSGLLNVGGDVTVGADKNLSGTVNIELGPIGNRTKAAMRISGTPADIKLSK